MNINKRDLTTNELLILNSTLRDTEKSLALGYLMLIGGHLGVHRFYLKRFGTAAAQLCLFVFAIISYMLTAVFTELEHPVMLMFGVLCMILSGGTLFVWILVDLFLLPGMIREWNEKAEQEAIQQIYQYRTRS